MWGVRVCGGVRVHMRVGVHLHVCAWYVCMGDTCVCVYGGANVCARGGVRMRVCEHAWGGSCEACVGMCARGGVCAHVCVG